MDRWVGRGTALSPTALAPVGSGGCLLSGSSLSQDCARRVLLGFRGAVRRPGSRGPEMTVKAGLAYEWGSQAGCSSRLWLILCLGWGPSVGSRVLEASQAPLQPAGRPWASDSSWSCCEPSLCRGLLIPGAAPPTSASSLARGSWGGWRPLGTATGLGGRETKGVSCSWQKKEDAGQLVLLLHQSAFSSGLASPHLGIPSRNHPLWEQGPLLLLLPILGGWAGALEAVVGGTLLS